MTFESYIDVYNLDNNNNILKKPREIQNGKWTISQSYCETELSDKSRFRLLCLSSWRQKWNHCFGWPCLSGKIDIIRFRKVKKIVYKIINQLQYADSELIIVENEHDFILFDSLINRRSQFLVTDVTKSSGLFCIRDDPSDEKRHKLKVKNKNFQPLKVTPGLNSSKFEVYKESCAEN